MIREKKKRKSKPNSIEEAVKDALLSSIPGLSARGGGKRNRKKKKEEKKDLIGDR